MRILLIEDDHRICAALKKGFQQEGYVVDVCHDGQEGLDSAMNEEYDVIILDILLPILDGLSVCRQLRSQKNHTPILLLTAKTQIEDKVRGLNTGADDYLTKPFSFEELLARVRALVRRPHVTVNHELTINKLRLDPNNHLVRYSETPVNLSVKEFALLEYLLRHQGQIKSKDQILNQVWSYDSDVLPNTIEATIRHIRQKLCLAGCNQVIITTVRGFGYMTKKN